MHHPRYVCHMAICVITGPYMDAQDLSCTYLAYHELESIYIIDLIADIVIQHSVCGLVLCILNLH